MIKNILFLLAIVILWLAFIHEGDDPAVDPFPDFSTPSQPAQISLPDFTCAGKRDCSEMVSCEEARFYMRYCPDTELDPDGDNVPCENLCTNNY